MVEQVVVGALLVLAAVILLWVCSSIQREDIWSIGIYVGGDPFSLHPHAAVGERPVLQAADISDVAVRFVADPFIVRVAAGWYLFFEALESASRRGVIGLASSENGYSWRYEQIVLREPFHLSYPYVFEWNGSYYMIPESGAESAVRLYRAVEFPGRWQFVCELLSGSYWDTSIIYRDGMWWLFSLDDKLSLSLHFAADLQGPWIPHPQSPVVQNNINSARPGGRLIAYQGKIIRYAQDGEPTYGSSLRAFQVDMLTTTSYREHEVAASPVLAASGRGWNRTGMHHADVHELGEGSWLAAVDGNKQRLRFNWRAGVRSILNTLK
jgi:hypothetical protein